MLKRVYDHFMKDTLYRNSIYLMLNTGIMAALGFVFWIIVARLYTPEQVGLGSALIAVISLITGLSMLGLDVALVRYLPTSKQKNETINTVLTLTGIAALFISTVYLLGLSWWSPDLLFLKQDLWYALGFIGAMIVMTLVSVLDNVFVSYRAAHYTLAKGSAFAVMKLVLPFVLVGFGAYGIFGSWVLAGFVSLIVGMTILIVRFRFPSTFSYHKSILRDIFGYGFGNFVAGFIQGLPLLLLPLIILAKFGAATTAHYYIAMQIATVLFYIPQAVNASLFAEGSNAERQMGALVKKSIQFMALILVPAIVVFVLFGGLILSAFGKTYAAESITLLRILTLSAILVGINGIMVNVLRVRNRITTLIVTSCIGAVVTLMLFWLYVTSLTSVGWMWVIGQVVLMIVTAIIVFVEFRKGNSI
jgi:O-antigen/teichoic acid export membrane protein